MRRVPFTAVACLLVAMAFLTQPAFAQYMYLDSNGDGVHTAADRVNLNTPTTADVWIKTNTNRDGSPGVCPTADGNLTINSYVVNLAASNGTVTYSGFVNRDLQANTSLVPFASNTTEMTVGWGGGTIYPPGTYRLFTVTITRTSGNPAVAIVAPSGLQPTDLTSFGSLCSGNDFDNTMKLESDWFDVDGLAATSAGGSPPIITAPAIVNGGESTPVTVTGSASDPDADLVTLSQSNNAAFFPQQTSSSGPSPNPSITLTGTPNFSQSGSYTIQWSAADNGALPLTSAATTAVAIGSGVNRNPVINVPASATGTEGSPVSITASALDPDGQPVTLCVTSKPVFIAGGPCAGPVLNPSITLTGTPGLNDAGNYAVTWTATDGAGTSAATTALAIFNLNRPPTLAQPANMTVDEGGFASQVVPASDPDGDPLIFSTVGPAPLFLAVSGNPTGPCNLVLTPGSGDGGSYTVTLRASDGVLFDTKTFGITVNDVNRCPVSDPGGPYSGVVGAPVTFNGSASSDPDGDALTYLWVFGDRTAVGTGPIVSHTYAARNGYNVSLTVSDGVCSATTSTLVFIEDHYVAVGFTTGGNDVTSLGSGKPFTCVEVEPFLGSFQITDVDLSSIHLSASGTGSVSSIPCVSTKTSLGGDKNGNGAPEIHVCFAKADLRQLFSLLPAGRNELTIPVEGNVTNGATFSAPVKLIVKTNGGGALAASLSPNPLNPSAKLSFATSKPGAVRVQLFDLSGRLVRTLFDERDATAGYHEATIDGRSSAGERLASGVYFVRIRAEHDGEATLRLTVLK